jgi:hypothetical protein
LVQAGALQDSQSPVDTEGAVMGHRGTFAIPPLVNFAHFRKVNVLVEDKSNLATMGQIRPAQPLRCCPGRTPVVTAWDTDNFW